MNDLPNIDVPSSVESVSGGQIKAIIERLERLDAEKKEIADQFKEVLSEAKGQGYCTKTLKKILALRKKSADERSEEEAMLEMYLTALGMSAG